MMKAESPDHVPTIISQEAWEVAMVIDEEIYKFLKDCGLTRVEGRSKMTESVARMVQLAINKILAKARNENRS